MRYHVLNIIMFWTCWNIVKTKFWEKLKQNYNNDFSFFAVRKSKLDEN